MIPYRNISGKSGVLAYEIGDTYIKIEFNNNEVYLYDYNRPGKVQVNKMKFFAVRGKGLSTYISRYVKSFAKKLG
ncbi:MAG: hypothetical protein JWO32_3083 [Bacteroidetes bacterium]|nr:hypothetical protein [Bacteroidota bacterium]